MRVKRIVRTARADRRKLLVKNLDVAWNTLLAIVYQRLRVLVCAPVLFVVPSHLSGQSHTVIEIGTTTANQAFHGLGFNLDADQEWEWEAAAAAGASHGRLQCSWDSVEKQTPAPANVASTPRYTQDPKCILGFVSARKYGIHPTVVAAFGPPYHKILDVILTGGAAVGSTTIDVQQMSGVGGDTLANIAFPYDYICPTYVTSSGKPGERCNGQFTGKHSYQGSLITSISRVDSTHAKLSLASAVTQALTPGIVTLLNCSIVANANSLTCLDKALSAPQIKGSQLMIPGAGRAGTSLSTTMVARQSATQITLAVPALSSVANVKVIAQLPYIVNEILYPSTASDSIADPSVLAYSEYVMFLARDMAARGVTGDIEMWNEPPWANDPWDFRAGLYDRARYSGPEEYGANYGFAANTMDRSLPSGIELTWNGTSGSSGGSLLASGMLRFAGKPLDQPSRVITKESFHPYGGTYGNPEDAMFASSCLQTAAAAKPHTKAANPFANGANCYLPGQAGTANFMEAVRLDLAAKQINPIFGIGHSITETNILPPAAGMQMQQARGVLRHFLGFQADGVTPIEFFKLYNGPGDPSFSFVYKNGEAGKYIATPAYTALSGVMADLKMISNLPVAAYSSASLPMVASYSGTYPLATAHLVGARRNAAANSDAFVFWQLSACTSSPSCWFLLPPPPSAYVVITIPVMMKVTSVVNLVSRVSVAYSSSGQQITLKVADDPIEMIVDPTSPAKL